MKKTNMTEHAITPYQNWITAKCTVFSLRFEVAAKANETAAISEQPMPKMYACFSSKALKFE